MGKLRYAETHWAREEDADKALRQYLALGQKPYNKTKQDLILSLLGDVSGKRILDYGGGAGYMAIPLAKAGAHVTVVDAEENGLQTALYYAKRENVAASVETFQSELVPDELKDGAFDVVLAKDIIEHIEDDQQFLDDLAACQASGGTLVLSTQNSRSLNYLIEGSYQKYRVGNSNWCGWDPTHLRFYTSTSLRSMLRNAGYRTERWASVYIVPYDIVNWMTMLKLDLELPALRYIDLTLGKVFPLNRTGWNIIVKASKR